MGIDPLWHVDGNVKLDRSLHVDGNMKSDGCLHTTTENVAYISFCNKQLVDKDAWAYYFFGRSGRVYALVIVVNTTFSPWTGKSKAPH